MQILNADGVFIFLHVFHFHTGDIFLRYLAASTAALFFLSLVGGFSAPLITKVLSCTGYLTQKGPATLNRLLETFQMVAECVVHGSEGMKPGGTVFSTAPSIHPLTNRCALLLLFGGIPAFLCSTHLVPCARLFFCVPNLRISNVL